MSRPLASIIIDNYNYERYLGAAIDSALAQTYPKTEVIVVDDGSTDGSRAILAAYGDRIVTVLKENGGMASTYNAGFAASRGDVIFLLDSDDLLVPTAVERAVALVDGSVTKVHWPLWKINEVGERVDGVVPPSDVLLAEGDLRESMIREGPYAYVSPPTSGNAWTRDFLELVLPMSEPEFRRGADAYLSTLAPLYGEVRRVAEPQGCYRFHSANDYASTSFADKTRLNIEIYRQRCLALSEHLRRAGITREPQSWMDGNEHYEWLSRLAAVTDALETLVPPGTSYVLVDDQQLADILGASPFLENRRAIPFLERDGHYWGAPADSETAIRELERLRRTGASLLVFAWPAFWWLGHYRALADHVRSSFVTVLENDLVVAFDLTSHRVAKEDYGHAG